MMLIDASYASCKVALSSKKYESVSAEFLKEWKILKQPNDVQFWELFVNQTNPNSLCSVHTADKSNFAVWGENPTILEICYCKS